MLNCQELSKKIWISDERKTNNIRIVLTTTTTNMLTELKLLPKNGTLLKSRRTMKLVRLPLNLKTNDTNCKLKSIVWWERQKLRMKNFNLPLVKSTGSKLRLRNSTMFKSPLVPLKSELKTLKLEDKSYKKNSTSRSLQTLSKNAMRKSLLETARSKTYKKHWFSLRRSASNSKMKSWLSRATSPTWKTWLRCFSAPKVSMKFPESSAKKWLWLLATSILSHTRKL